MSEADALAEIDRRVAVIEAAREAQPPRRLPLLIDADEAELEQCRADLNALLFRAEAIATRLRKRYGAMAADALSASRQIG